MWRKTVSELAYFNKVSPAQNLELEKRGRRRKTFRLFLLGFQYREVIKAMWRGQF
jgi:hypothetical protein